MLTIFEVLLAKNAVFHSKLISLKGYLIEITAFQKSATKAYEQFWAVFMISMFLRDIYS